MIIMQRDLASFFIIVLENCRIVIFLPIVNGLKNMFIHLV